MRPLRLYGTGETRVESGGLVPGWIGFGFHPFEFLGGLGADIESAFDTTHKGIKSSPAHFGTRVNPLALATRGNSRDVVVLCLRWYDVTYLWDGSCSQKIKPIASMTAFLLRSEPDVAQSKPTWASLSDSASSTASHTQVQIVTFGCLYFPPIMYLWNIPFLA